MATQHLSPLSLACSFLLFSGSAVLAGPDPMITAAPAFGGINHNALFGRQQTYNDNDRRCGYTDGYADDIYSCSSTDQCFSQTQTVGGSTIKAFGCCDQDTCNPQTTCLDYSSSSDMSTAVRQSGTVTCGAERPYCTMAHLIDSGETFTQVGCGRTSLADIATILRTTVATGAPSSSGRTTVLPAQTVSRSSGESSSTEGSTSTRMTSATTTQPAAATTTSAAAAAKYGSGSLADLAGGMVAVLGAMGLM